MSDAETLTTYLARAWWERETGETDRWEDLDAIEREAAVENSYAEGHAEAVLASDWLAEVRAQARREALSEAAQGLSDKMRFFEPASEMDIGFYDAHMSIVRTLRQRAEAVGTDG